MNRLLLIPFFFIACVCIAGPPVIQCKIIAYGIIEHPLGMIDTHIIDPDVPSGYRHSWTYRAMYSKRDSVVITNRISAKVGLTFGIQYVITTGSTNANTVHLTRILRYPPITRPDGRTFVGSRHTSEGTIKHGGMTGTTGFTFDFDYELVPGEYEIEIKVNDQTVCDQRFNVVKE